MRKQPPTPTVSADTLRSSIKTIDANAQHGFELIASVARLALMAMESPSGANLTQHLAQALSLIEDTALEVGGSINYAAEEVGCNHIDPAERRRFKAGAVVRAARGGE